MEFLKRAGTSTVARKANATTGPTPGTVMRRRQGSSSRTTAQQMIEALSEETGVCYVIRDRDAIYGTEFQRRVAGMGLTEVLIAPRSPWQNAYAERFVGSLRRECLDHVIALNERQVYRIVSNYAHYYNRARTHLALAKDAPEARRVQSRANGRVVAFPGAGGLHHRYERLAS